MVKWVACVMLAIIAVSSTATAAPASTLVAPGTDRPPAYQPAVLGQNVSRNLTDDAAPDLLHRTPASEDGVGVHASSDTAMPDMGDDAPARLAGNDGAPRQPSGTDSPPETVDKAIDTVSKFVYIQGVSGPAGGVDSYYRGNDVVFDDGDDKPESTAVANDDFDDFVRSNRTPEAEPEVVHPPGPSAALEGPAEGTTGDNPPEPIPTTYSPTTTSLPVTASDELPAAVIASLSLGLIALMWALARFALGPLVGLFAHIPRNQALEHPNRKALHDFIAATPGSSHADLCRISSLSRTAVGYHLEILERHGFVKSLRSGKTRRYYLTGAGFSTKAHAALLSANHRHLAEHILEQPGVIQKELCALAGIKPNRAHERLKHLIDAGMVVRSSQGRCVRYYPTATLTDLLSTTPESSASASA